MLETSFHRQFMNIGQAAVHDRILVWLHWAGAKGIVDNGASIEASHGSILYPFNWSRDGKKRLFFSISSNGQSVFVTATVRPSLVGIDETFIMIRRARRNWAALIDECWAYVEGRPCA